MAIKWARSPPSLKIFMLRFFYILRFSLDNLRQQPTNDVARRRVTSVTLWRWLRLKKFITTYRFYCLFMSLIFNFFDANRTILFHSSYESDQKCHIYWKNNKYYSIYLMDKSSFEHRNSLSNYWNNYSAETNVACKGKLFKSTNDVFYLTTFGIKHIHKKQSDK